MSLLSSGQRLSPAFYERDTVTVARALLGQRLVRVLDGVRLGGLICETEAYGGPEDRASHAYRRTPRSAIMYGPAGHAYIYFIYGMHYCLNAVTAADGCPGAALIRAIMPDEGVAIVRQRRGGAPDRRLTDGPGKVCAALAITTALNGCYLPADPELFIEAGALVPEAEIVATPRCGVRGDETALTRPWRFVWRKTDGL